MLDSEMSPLYVPCDHEIKIWTCWGDSWCAGDISLHYVLTPEYRQEGERAQPAALPSSLPLSLLLLTVQGACSHPTNQ